MHSDGMLIAVHLLMSYDSYIIYVGSTAGQCGIVISNDVECYSAMYYCKRHGWSSHAFEGAQLQIMLDWGNKFMNSASCNCVVWVGRVQMTQLGCRGVSDV